MYIKYEKRLHLLMATLVGYLMPNLIYTHIHIYVCVIYSTYEHKWVCPIPHKYIGHYCEEGKTY